MLLGQFRHVVSGHNKLNSWSAPPCKEKHPIYWGNKGKFEGKLKYKQNKFKRSISMTLTTVNILNSHLPRGYL